MLAIKKQPYNMKKKILLFSTAALFLVAAFTACKKENNTSTDNTEEEASFQSEDQQRFSSETQSVANDAGIALETFGSFSGRMAQNPITICHATAVFDSVSSPKTITITYDGADCFTATTRTGVIVVSMEHDVHWKDAGAAVTITYQNYKVTRLSDNKSITINGSQTYTNVSGGLLISLLVPGTHITRSLTSDDMSVTFDNGALRTWHTAEQAMLTNDNGKLVVTLSGIHTDGNDTGIAEWGTNRFGHAFVSSTVDPIVIRQDCNFRIVSGEIKHVTPNITANATFGLDVSGNSTSCPGSGHYYFKVIWTGTGGNSLTVIMPY
jgi:hypothetical protein